ncbi:MAG: AAA-like domain [Bradyrhizobium sp.]|jgi:transcriptional regulator with XRE-family HTH domain|nr:AAA-like domain [Bradyrhizobium sp.]
MADDVFISDQMRQKLPAIFKQLGIRQHEVASAIGISAASISRFTSTGPDRINFRPENLQGLVQVLKKRLTELREIKSLSNKELEARRKVDRSAVAAAIGLSRDAINTLEMEIANLLVAESALTTIGTVLAMPGGALPAYASNYVERKADKDIEEILGTVRSPSSVVLGPINGGASSFLARVYQRARDMPNSWAGMANLGPAFSPGETFTQLDLFKFLFRELGVNDDVLADDKLDVHDMKAAFDAWAQVEWKDATRVVVIVDGLDEIFKNAGAIVDPLAVTNWFQSLRNRAAHGIAPYDKLALFVALTGATWSAAHGSPYASQAGYLDLNKFSSQEAAEVFKQLQVDIDQAGLKEVYRLFHGHPYLTQLFAWSMRDGLSLQAAKEAALGLESRYEIHWERMKSEIGFLIGKNYPVRKVLTLIAKVAEQSKPNALDETEDEIWRSYRRGLRIFGLIDGKFDSPTICEFYRTAIQREVR